MTSAVEGLQDGATARRSDAISWLCESAASWLCESAALDVIHMIRERRWPPAGKADREADEAEGEMGSSLATRNDACRPISLSLNLLTDPDSRSMATSGRAPGWSAKVADHVLVMPTVISMPSAIATNVNPMSLARNSERSMDASSPPELPVQGTIRSSARRDMRQLVVAEYRLAWCSVQWRMWPREAGRSGRRLVARLPCVDPI